MEIPRSEVKLTQQKFERDLLMLYPTESLNIDCCDQLTDSVRVGEAEDLTNEDPEPR